VTFFGLIQGQKCLAQDGGSGGLTNELGVFIGRVLPNGVDGAPEIFSLSGLRYSRAFSPASNSFWEVGGTFGDSRGVEWTSLFASLRMDIPIETFVALAYLGGDFTRYSSVDQPQTDEGGAHLGGGLMSNLGGATWWRFDMKLTSKPGTTLFFGLTLFWRF